MKKLLIMFILLLVVLTSCNKIEIENENITNNKTIYDGYHEFCSDDNIIDTKIEYVIFGEVCKSNYKEVKK